MLIETQ